MLEIHKKILLDEYEKPCAVQIPIEEFEHIEDVIENYGLSKLIEEVENDERLSVEDDKKYYRNLNVSY